MYDHFFKLGEWGYSPDDKDSLWNQTPAPYNLTIIKEVLKDYEVTERKWDSLIFLSKKYDSIPFPSELILDRHRIRIESKNSLVSWKEAFERGIASGMLDKNGRERN